MRIVYARNRWPEPNFLAPNRTSTAAGEKGDGEQRGARHPADHDTRGRGLDRARIRVADW